MDTDTTLDPVFPPDGCGYQTWIVTLGSGMEVAVCANSEEAAIKVWLCSDAYKARPMRRSDIGGPALRRGRDGYSSRFD